VISWAEAHDVGVIVYSPMQSGLLSGTFTVRSAEQLAQGDWRRSSPDFTDRLAANLALAEALKPIADRHGVTPGAITIAWTLAWSGVTGAIVGARRPAQIDGWIDAATVQLTGDDLDDIASAIAATGAGEGPNHPLGSWAPSTLS
jgi:aryl-alcohol dehydrogenase-like predicted oxidoreductase